ncbi:MAG: nuclear transport factor 2 family protein [Nitrososphaerota archaeon]|nr:nuclear transport factor 2 family protein [Nitrososphaerota archaeon]
MDSETEAKRAASAVIYAMFEAGKNKDLSSLARLHSDLLTKFDEFPPYSRQSYDDALVYEQAAFANISDYDYKITELRVDVVGAAAVATFYLEYSGVFVNDYSFEGRPVGSRSRVTMVLAMSADGWKIVHEHFSAFPEWPSKPQKGGP